MSVPGAKAERLSAKHNWCACLRLADIAAPRAEFGSGANSRHDGKELASRQSPERREMLAEGTWT